MLHICNTLHKYRERYTFKTSDLHHCVLRVILHLEHLPLQQETNRTGGCRKSHFRVLFSFAIRVYLENITLSYADYGINVFLLLPASSMTSLSNANLRTFE